MIAINVIKIKKYRCHPPELCRKLNAAPELWKLTSLKNGDIEIYVSKGI